MPMPGSIDYQ